MLSHRLVACDGPLIRTAAGRKCVCALRGFICLVVRDAIKVRYAFVNVPNALVIFAIRSRDQMNNSYTLFQISLLLFFLQDVSSHRHTGIVFFFFLFSISYSISYSFQVDPMISSYIIG